MNRPVTVTWADNPYTEDTTYSVPADAMISVERGEYPGEIRVKINGPTEKVDLYRVKRVLVGRSR